MLLNCDVAKNSQGSLGGRAIKPVNPKGNQIWIYIRRIDVEAETPLAAKNGLIGKDHDSGKGWRQEEKWTTEDEVRWDGLIASLNQMGWFDSITESMDVSLSKYWKTVRDRESWHAAVHRVAKSKTRPSNWTTTKSIREETEQIIPTHWYIKGKKPT